MIRINDILDKAGEYLNQSELALIQKAYVYAASVHSGQVRLSGEPYFSHPLEVSNILAEMRLDSATIASGLLHDTVEDAGVKIQELEEHFGPEVARIVDGVTKIGKVTFTSKEEAQAENIRKMILAMAKDIRVILVKLADRLHNMRTLEHQNQVKQKLIAQETLEIYAALAHRLGLYRIKVDLDDLSLKYLKPDVYQHIVSGISQHRTLGEDYIQNVISVLQKMLDENNIQGHVSGRQKHIYSIYSKMQKQNLSLEQVYDLIAFRVILQSIKDCYAVLGLVHSTWTPVPGRFKDYISMPKGNMYQSLHTTVVGPGGEHIEIQIRTEQMHQIAEYGVAAHWKYKDGETFNPKDEQRFDWLRHILDWEQELKDPREFMASLKVDLFQDEVYVFTPKGEVLDLPYGATPVDFAYLIHTEVGNQCSGAKVNGKLVPLDTQLKNGDTVEIITNPHRKPSRDWLRFVKTTKARTRIKHWIRTEERARSISLAKEMLEKEGRRMNINFQQALKKGSLDPVAAEFSYKQVDDLLSAVGYAKITPKQVLRRLLPKETKQEEKQAQEAARAERKEKEKKEEKEQKKEGVSIKGIDDVLIRFAHCCQPVPGDPIIGYISRGRGVIVHTTDCPNVAQFAPARLLNVSWAGEEKDTVYPATIKVLSKNLPGVMAQISSQLAQEDVNIESGHFSSDLEGKTEIILNVEVNDSSHLYRTLKNLNNLDNVLEAIRTSSKSQ
ncbi:MAG: RelA/SpoT family protein [Thermodesulfobacteriota bacterium]